MPPTTRRSTSRPRSRSRRPRRASSRWPRPASTAKGFAPSLSLTKPSRWRTMPTSATAASPASPPGSRTSTPSWAAATLRPHHHRRATGDGQVVAGHQYRLPRRQARARSLAERPDLRADDPSHDGAASASFAMSAEQLATRILSEQCGILREDPPRHDRRRRVQAPGRGEPGDRQLVALHRPDRRDHHRPAGGARGASSASMAWVSSVVDYLQSPAGSARRAKRGARPGGGRDHHRPEGAGQGAGVPILALPSSRARWRTARTSGRSWPICASGSIEQDADVVMFVYREEYYVERAKPAEGTLEFQDWQPR